MSLTDVKTKSLADRLPPGLLDRIVAHLNPIKVIVFGSRATRNIHEDSDWDLLIVVDDDIPSGRIDWRGIGEARRGVRGAIDLIPCRESTFHDRKDIVGSLPCIALNEGVAVYERSKAA